MGKINTSTTKPSIGDLVWIPANTPLMYYQDPNPDTFNWRSTEKKEPVYGLVLQHDDKSVFKVLVGYEEFFVRKSEVYGV
jgi:hypothetical protein